MADSSSKNPSNAPDPDSQPSDFAALSNISSVVNESDNASEAAHWDRVAKAARFMSTISNTFGNNYDAALARITEAATLKAQVSALNAAAAAPQSSVGPDVDTGRLAALNAELQDAKEKHNELQKEARELQVQNTTLLNDIQNLRARWDDPVTGYQATVTRLQKAKDEIRQLDDEIHVKDSKI